ncbi:fatty acid-binding protein 1-like [Anticarsia gemmatalis]|uniref:fatty acid-binding protein 1-like n=1 Tax=Anticarsia gemmatalis TaxID=129554 RepID=UPI003F774582
MAFLGKEYAFDRQENFEDFVNSLGLTPEQAAGFINYHPNQKLVQDGAQYTLVTITPTNKKELTFTPGVAFDEKVADRTSKTTFTLDGNKLTQTQTFEDGSTFNFVRVYSDSELVVTITSNKYNGTAYRYYKA